MDKSVVKEIVYLMKQVENTNLSHDAKKQAVITSITKLYPNLDLDLLGATIDVLCSIGQHITKRCCV